MVFANMFAAFTLLQVQNDDDVMDRLNYLYTPSFIIMMAILVSFKQYGGRPLECWVPAQFTASWQTYAETYCWAQNTYFVPPADESITSENRKASIAYYQWVPFFLLAQAFKFYFPCLVWRMLNDKSGMNIHDIITAAKSRENLNPDTREHLIQSLGKHIESYLEYRPGDRSKRCWTLFNVHYYKTFITGLYLFCKFLFIVNIGISLYLLNNFLRTGNDGWMYGVEVLLSLLRGESWKDSGNFPRVTMCDFDIRVVGSVQKHTAQCMLVINIFNEKIFILFWFWFTLLLFLTICDALFWIISSLSRRERLKFLLRHVDVKLARSQDRKLPSESDMATLNERIREDFVDYIQLDGHFVLRMIGLHAGLIFCSELTKQMWLIYLERHNLAKFSAVVRRKSSLPASKPPLKTDL